MRRALSFALLPVAAFAALAAVALASGACGDDSSKPTGSGDHVTVDVDATTQPSQNQNDASYYSDVYGPGDGPYADPPDGYAPYASCSKCTCPASTFCFGGGTGYTSGTPVCGAGATLPGAGSVQLGCNAIPPLCAGKGPKEICACLIATLSPLLPCYSVCTDTPQLILYCPHP
jgi:hypothetical protein